MKFYKPILMPVDNPILYAYGLGCSLKLKDRIENNGKCPDCGKDEWMFLPKEGSAVRAGGKPYIECLECGYMTHL